MKKLILINYLFITILSAGEIQKISLSMKSFSKENYDIEYRRGSYLIILADSYLFFYLTDSFGGSFKDFKELQGFDVDVISLNEENLETAEEIKDWISTYYNSHPSLEYVLLVGDVNGTYTIPSFFIQSINEPELDVTDYPYTFFDSNDILSPKYFIGRWSVSSPNDLINIKVRTMQYFTMENLSETEKQYLNNALLVAGNYKQTSDGDEVPPETWPVTPVWTSFWLMEELYQFGYTSIDTAFFHAGYQISNNPVIGESWTEGVGIINYRGWGNSHGWHKPEFYIEDINDLNHGWKLPVVMSFVCNTGDFGADVSPQSGPSKCFGEELLTKGTPTNPKGAAAMIGPSDLDTDTRFNNVMCGAMWDEFLEGRESELGPALFAGKQALIKEFPELTGANEVVEFYHHIYGILGDPSLSVWLQAPETMTAYIEDDPILNSSFVTTVVTDENMSSLADVVGALLYNGNLIAKGLSNHEGVLNIDFENVPVGATLELYLNKAQFMQKHISLTFSGDNGEELNDYYIHEIERTSEYNFYDSESGHELRPVYDWIEINEIGTNLNLVDDSHATDVSIGFNFQYYGESYNILTVGSNGWASFLPCLDGNNDGDCRVISHFFNNSIGFPIGPYGLLAPFYDDLDDNEGTEPFNVYHWQDAEDHQFIVQWDNLANGENDDQCEEDPIPDPETCYKETFQLILLDPAYYPTTTGNGAIIFQYKEIHDIDDHGCTVGIEAPDKDEGVEYLFNYRLAVGASGLADGLAIKFTTEGNGMGVNPSSTPQNFTLMQNYPNPFNPSTTIQYHLNQKGTVNISVYNLSGQKIRQLVDSNQDPGQHSVSWDGKDEKGIAVGSGMYFYRLNVHSAFSDTHDGLSKAGKMILLR